MSAVELSPHYLEILKLMLNNKSSRYISKYLLDNYNEKISHVTLSKFKKNNVDIADLIQQIEAQQGIIKEGKIDVITDGKYDEEIIEVVNDKIRTNKEAQKLIINEINEGIDVLNLVRNGLSISEDADVFNKFFTSDDVTLKDKMDMTIKLAKLEMDWQKSNDTNININNNNMITDLSNIFAESTDWSESTDWAATDRE